MKEIPMIFNGGMVRAILDGRKTNTRRPLNIPAGFEIAPEYGFSKLTSTNSPDMKRHIGKWGAMAKRKVDRFTEFKFIPAPCTKGDLIYVRENYMPDAPQDGSWGDVEFYGCNMAPLSLIPKRFRKPKHCIYQATWDESELVGWKPSIHMPKWAARTWLEVLDVKLERIQDIDEAGAHAEGIKRAVIKEGPVFNGMPTHPYTDTYKNSFQKLWDSIYKKQGKAWDANPWVWVISFKKANIEH